MRYYPSFNDVFDDLFDTESRNPTKANTMLCDIRETENSYVMNIALPGYKKEDIGLELKDGYLKVSAAGRKEINYNLLITRDQ